MQKRGDKCTYILMASSDVTTTGSQAPAAMPMHACTVTKLDDSVVVVAQRTANDILMLIYWCVACIYALLWLLTLACIHQSSAAPTSQPISAECTAQLLPPVCGGLRAWQTHAWQQSAARHSSTASETLPWCCDRRRIDRDVRRAEPAADRPID